MPKEKKKDLLKVAKRESYFSTLAREEGKGAAQREKKERKEGLPEAAKDSKWERKVDAKFANLRAVKATKARKKAKELS